MVAIPSKTQRVAAVIPARLASTRLPRKVLRQVAGRPLLAWVVDAARSCPQFDEIVVATDSDEVAALCVTHGWAVRMTAAALQSGTDRLHAVAQDVLADIYVNVQGDEPLLQPSHITALLRPFAHEHVQVSTIKTLCTPENIANPNAVKVVTDKDGRALYFSRATIPHDRDGSSPRRFKHLGLYAYRKAALDRFVSLPESSLERSERLEQLRFLENGISIYVGETAFDSVGVDTEEDLQRVVQLLKNR